MVWKNVGYKERDDKNKDKIMKMMRRKLVIELGNKPGTAQVGAISKAQKDSRAKTTFSTLADNKSSQKTKN